MNSYGNESDYEISSGSSNFKNAKEFREFHIGL